MSEDWSRPVPNAPNTIGQWLEKIDADPGLARSLELGDDPAFNWSNAFDIFACFIDPDDAVGFGDSLAGLFPFLQDHQLIRDRQREQDEWPERLYFTPPVRIPLAQLTAYAEFWSQHISNFFELYRLSQAPDFPSDLAEMLWLYGHDIQSGGRYWDRGEIGQFIENVGVLRGLTKAAARGAPEHLLEEILAQQRSSMAIHRAHFEHSLRVGEATQRIEAKLQSFEDLLLDSVIRISETLDVISDRYYERTADELVRKWTEAASDRAERELADRCEGFVGGETTWTHLDPESQRDLRAYAILKRDWRPEHARLAAMALCVAFERELREALMRRGEPEIHNIENLIGRAWAFPTDSVLHRVAAICQKPRPLAALRNSAAHPGRGSFGEDDLTAIEQRLLDPARGVDGTHCLLSNVVMSERKSQESAPA